MQQLDRRNVLSRDKHVGPIGWPFVIALIVFALGLLFKSSFLTWVGGFVILIYVLVWVVWIISQASQ